MPSDAVTPRDRETAREIRAWLEVALCDCPEPMLGTRAVQCDGCHDRAVAAALAEERERAAQKVGPMHDHEEGTCSRCEDFKRIAAAIRRGDG